MGHLLDILAADAAGKHAQADVAFKALRAEQASRATLNSAGQAIDASLRAAFEANNTSAKPVRFPTQDTLDPAYMQSQIAEARAMLDAADKALCGWFGTPNPERARELFDAAIGFLAEE